MAPVGSHHGEIVGLVDRPVSLSPVSFSLSFHVDVIGATVGRGSAPFVAESVRFVRSMRTEDLPTIDSLIRWKLGRTGHVIG
jgi:hypothetical protein